MLKLIALSAVLASTPLCFVVTAPQDPGERPAPTRAPSTEMLEELTRLRADLERARADLRAARAELEECLDLLEAPPPRQRRSCNPSRSSLLSHCQWLQERGHQQRADRMLERIVEEHGREPSRLNNVAWSLMTEKENAGRFDRVALSLTQRMLASGQQPHRHLDTAALAHFLNGDVEAAVRLQREALAQHENDDDYRRRLRTYEAAQRVAAPAAPAAAVAIAKSE